MKHYKIYDTKTGEVKQVIESSIEYVSAACIEMNGNLPKEKGLVTFKKISEEEAREIKKALEGR